MLIFQRLKQIKTMKMFTAPISNMSQFIKEIYVLLQAENICFYSYTLQK